MPIRKTASGGRITGVEVHEAGGDNTKIVVSESLLKEGARQQGWVSEDEQALAAENRDADGQR
jgi:hypothetical protein